MTFDAQPKRKVPSGNDMAQVSAIATAWGLKLRLADGPKSAKFGLKLSRTRGLGAAGKDGKLTLDARENLLHNHQSASSLECCDFEQIQPTHAPLGWRRSNDGGGHSNFIAPGDYPLGIACILAGAWVVVIFYRRQRKRRNE